MTQIADFRVGDIRVGDDHPPLFIMGPCAIESEELTLRIADFLAETAEIKKINLIFKASYDKANRSSIDSYRGPGRDEGLQILAKVKEKTGLPILTDVHETREVVDAASVVDVLQIPAFLMRQTDLLIEAARTGCPINVKKGQFAAPEDMKNVVEKVFSRGNKNLLVTERGTFFGYRDLVVDFRSFMRMRDVGCPIIFDATHSVQQPGGLGASSGGERQFVRGLIRGACAVGIHGLFIETHPDPERALCDGPNCLPLEWLDELIDEVRRIREAVNLKP